MSNVFRMKEWLTKLVISEIIPINKILKNIAFLRCTYGPGLSTMLIHNAPKEIEIPNCNSPNLEAIKLGNTTPNVMRSPSPKCGERIKFFKDLMIVSDEVWKYLIQMFFCNLANLRVF